MRPVILKTGRALPEIVERRGDFEQLFAEGMGWPLDRFEVVDAERGDVLPDPAGIDGVIVTGSPASVYHHAPWSDRAARWAWSAVEAGVPVLAVCYGHQLLAEAGGGRVALNPRGREIGLCEVTVTGDDPLFEGLPATFPVLETHIDAVIAPPPPARVIASNPLASVQAMAFGSRARSVQWHPELDAGVMRSYIKARAVQIDDERGPGAAARLAAATTEAPSGAVIFQNFIRHFLR